MNRNYWHRSIKTTSTVKCYFKTVRRQTKTKAKISNQTQKTLTTVTTRSKQFKQFRQSKQLKHSINSKATTNKSQRWSRRKTRRNRLKWRSEIRHYQATTYLLIPKLAMSRLIRSIGDRYSPNLRWTKYALEALQCAAEEYITSLFNDALSTYMYICNIICVYIS